MSAAGLPASFAQDRLWFLDQLEPGTAAYNLVRAFRITGPLNVNALTSAIGAVIERHESLRTIFESVDGEDEDVDSYVDDADSDGKDQRRDLSLTALPCPALPCPGA